MISAKCSRWPGLGRSGPGLAGDREGSGAGSANGSPRRGNSLQTRQMTRQTRQMKRLAWSVGWQPIRRLSYSATAATMKLILIAWGCPESHRQTGSAPLAVAVAAIFVCDAAAKLESLFLSLLLTVGTRIRTRSMVWWLSLPKIVLGLRKSPANFRTHKHLTHAIMRKIHHNQPHCTQLPAAWETSRL